MQEKKFLKLELTDEQKSKLSKFLGKKNVPSYVIFPHEKDETKTIKNLSGTGDFLAAGCCMPIIGPGCTGQDDEH